MNLKEDMIIDAIIGGTIIPNGGIDKKLTTLNDNNEWEWNREELKKKNILELIDIYITHNRNKDVGKF